MNYIGEIKLWSGEYEPAGWTFCDGKQLLKGEFPDLYSVIGDTFAISITKPGYFSIPNLERPNAIVDPNPGDSSGGAGYKPMYYIICYQGYIDIEVRVQNYSAVLKDDKNPEITKKDATFIDKKTPTIYKNRG